MRAKIRGTYTLPRSHVFKKDGRNIHVHRFEDVTPFILCKSKDDINSALGTLVQSCNREPAHVVSHHYFFYLRFYFFSNFYFYFLLLPSQTRPLLFVCGWPHQTCPFVLRRQLQRSQCSFYMSVACTAYQLNLLSTRGRESVGVKVCCSCLARSWRTCVMHVFLAVTCPELG